MESVIFSLDNRIDLLDNIIGNINEYYGYLNKPILIGRSNIETFSDGEMSINYLTSLRSKRVYILASTKNSDDIILLNFAIDAAKRAAAYEIIPILPYFSYARQDKIDNLRGSIGAKVIAEMLEHRGATSVITFDLHAEQIQGFFNIPVIHMEGKYLFASYIADNITSNTILCAPDSGASKRVKGYRDWIKEKYNINLNYVTIDKTRKEANVVDNMIIIGDVKGKEVIIIDDMVDTGGTLCKASEELINAGAITVRAIATHGVLSGSAYDKILKSTLLEFVCSDSLVIQSKPKIKVISVAKQIAKAIIAINNNTSIDELKRK